MSKTKIKTQNAGRPASLPGSAVYVDNRKHKFSGRALAVGLISALLSVAAIAGGIVFMNTVGYTVSDMRRETVYIRSGEQLLECMGARIVNDEYRLLSDIKIDAKKWNDQTERLVFSGVLNGNGHTVTVEGKLTAPLFSRIADGGTVSHITFDGVQVNGAGDYAAVITRFNYGEISDCAITNASLTVGEVKFAAFAAAYNFGSITNCVVSGTFDAGEYSAGRTSVGGVTAVNYKDASVDGVIVLTAYKSGFEPIEQPYYNENEVNDKLGYAVGQNSGSMRKVYCVDAEMFGNSSDGKTSPDLKSVTLSELNQAVFTDIGFDSDYWTVAAGKLPTVKALIDEV